MQQRRKSETRERVELEDENEQEAQIQSLGKDIVRLAQTHARTSIILGIPLVILFTSFAVIQYISPWSLRHHRVFVQERQAAFDYESQSTSIVFGELSCALSLAFSTLATYTFVHGSQWMSWKHALHCSYLLTGLQFIYWSAAIYSIRIRVDEVPTQESSSSLQKIVWLMGRVGWKPIMPILWSIANTVMIDSISRLQIDLGELHRLKYKHKSL